MGEVIFDLQEVMARRARERDGSATVADHAANGERIKAQVHAAVQAARVPLAEARGRKQGRQEERTVWGLRMAFLSLVWLTITAFAFACGYLLGAR